MSLVSSADSTAVSNSTADQRKAARAAGRAPVYFDYYSTTPTDPRVLAEMIPYFTQQFGNAHSRSHAFGWAAEKGVDIARERVAALIGANEAEIVFTSGGTESCNLAIKGVAKMYAEKGRHIVTTSVEHRSVMDPIRSLEREGWTVTYLPVDTTAMVDPDVLAAALREDTVLVSVIFANNEVGTVNPIGKIGAICKDRGVLFHVDACIGLDTETIDVERDGIDLLSISAHKIYGPKGAGALYVRRRKPRVRLAPLLDGGGQERGMRHGTLNVPGIVGLGKAAELCGELRGQEGPRIRAIRDRMRDAITQEIDYTHWNGHTVLGLPGILNLSFEFIEGESMIMGMQNVAVSSGSACTSSTLEPSHVLKAMNVGEEKVHTSIRFVVGRFTTEADADVAIERAITTAKKLREMSPLYEMVKEGIDLKSIEWKHD